MFTALKRGYVFTHDSFLDRDWKPGPGQKYVDGPKAEMVVVRVTTTTVWYGYAGQTRGPWKMSRDLFIDRYLKGTP